MLRRLVVFLSSFLGLALLCNFSSYLTLQRYLVFEWSKDVASVHNIPVSILLWWTPFLTEQRRVHCGHYECLLTSNRSYLKHRHLKGLLFYGSSFNKDDVPPRSSAALWGLFHEESPRNVPLLAHSSTLSLFNYSATFSRASHLPLTLQFLPSLDDLIGRKYFKSFEMKNQFRNSLAPVLYLQSDCSTPNNRDSYVAELMKYIQVDSYGACLNNRKFPRRLEEATEHMMSTDIMEMVSRYKFSIAIENALCDDYITEKLWRPLIAGSIPLYVGSPSVVDWLPNNNSAIFPLNFENPEKLANYLHHLDRNENAYEQHLFHKLKGSISNRKLEEEFKGPMWPEDSLGVVEDFECLMCRQSYEMEPSTVTIEQYDCPKPYSILSRKHNSSNWWHQLHLYAACEASAFKEFVAANYSRGETFTNTRQSEQFCADLF